MFVLAAATATNSVGPSTSRRLAVTSPSSPAPTTASARRPRRVLAAARCPRAFPRTCASTPRPTPSTASPAVVALEADLLDVGHPARLFDPPSSRLGPVDILVNNATGWVQDTFKPSAVDRFGRPMLPVTADTVDRNLGVDARASALLIAEFAAPSRRTRRDVGPHRRAHLRWPARLPRGGLVRRGEGCARALHARRRRRARRVRHHRQHRVPAGHRHRLGHRRRAAGGRRVASPDDVAEVIAYLCSDAARS